MTVVSVLRLLWLRRWLVVLGIALAFTVELFVTFRPSLSDMSLQLRQHKVGVASASFLVDLRESQVVDLGDEDTATPDVGALIGRARLLANLAMASPLKDQIARAAGVEPDRLIARVTSDTESPLPEESDLRPKGPDVSILNLTVSESVPIVTADAQAPNEPAARELANSTASAVAAYLAKESAGVPDERRLVVTPLGSATSSIVTKGSGPLVGIAVFLFVLGLWCAAIVAVTALARSWRLAEAAEREAAAAADAPVPVPADPDSLGSDRLDPDRILDVAVIAEVHDWAPEDAEATA